MIDLNPLQAQALDEVELYRVVYSIYQEAKAIKAPVDERFRRWKDYFDLKPPQPSKPTLTSVATPTVRQKVDGIRSHIKMAIDRSPLFTARPLSKEAADAVGPLEALMESELKITRSRRAIEQAIDDAVLHGTGILKIVLRREGGEPLVAIERVPVQNALCWPKGVDNPQQLIWFHRFYMPWWALEQAARQGLYRPEAVEGLKGMGSSLTTPEGFEAHYGGASSPEHRWHELVEGWLKWQGQLVRVVFREGYPQFLQVEVDPFEGIIDHPPFFPVWIDPDPVEIWGHGLAEVLESYQLVADTAINYELWASGYKLSPPVLVQAGSATHKALAGKSIEPGMLIPFDGPAPEEVLYPLKMEFNPFNQQTLALMLSLAEDASFPDFIVPGQPMGGRRTAAEVQLMSSIAQIKLQNYVRTVAATLETVAEVYWKLFPLKLREVARPGLPRGVMPVYSLGGDASRRYVAIKTVDMVLEGPAVPTPMGSIPKRYRLYIPGVDRSDISWYLTSSSTVPEREMRTARLSALLNPAMIQMIQIARQDVGIYVLMRRFLESLGMGAEAEDILGPKPKPATLGQQTLQGILQGALGGGMMGGNAGSAEPSPPEGPEGPQSSPRGRAQKGSSGNSEPQGG